MPDHPPKPRLTLRVGITGHRPKPHRLPPASVERVKDQLRAVFAAIDGALHAAHGESAAFYSAEPAQVRLVSGLAEGADQLAVDVRPQPWTIDAILPFPQSSYLKDFEKSAAGDGRDVRPEFAAALKKVSSVTELPEEPGPREVAYARLGAFLLRQIDLLVAVWDGGPSEGPGGTTDVVKKAIEAGIPVIWIHAIETIFPRFVDEIGDDGRPVAPSADCTRGLLGEVIAPMVSAPAAAAGPFGGDHADGPSAEQRLRQFFGETWPRKCRWVAYDMFRRLAEGRWVRLAVPFALLQDYAGDWDRFVAEAPPVGALSARIIAIGKPRYAWADALAIYFANLYRSAYITVYLAAACAVAIGLCAVFLHGSEPESALALKSIFVAIELIIIIGIIVVVSAGRRGRWHQRFIEYRALAEMLRDVRFLAYAGENGRVLRTDELGSASAWFLWYLRATIRELGLPYAVLDGTYQHIHLTAVEKHTIADQIEHHRRNAVTLVRMHRAIHGVGDFCFYATGVVLFVWLVGLLAVRAGECLNVRWDFLARVYGWLQTSKDGVTYVAAWLPALGAALAGIRETGDFEGVAALSAKTAAALEALKRDYAEAKRTLLLNDTGDVLIGTAQVLTDDLAAWRSLYGRKRLTLPA